MTDAAVRAADGRLWIGERSLPLIEGEVQFWRMDPDSWRPVLERTAELGVPVISTYLSWRRHERRPGELDWGADDPRLDARRFLDLCDELGLAVHLKPGPWICAEETGGGYPDWLLATPGVAALDASGRPVVGYNPPFLHVVPSPWDERYRTAVRRWFTAVWRELGDLRHPDGPVVAVQLDNEPGLCFQDAFTFADYHPDAITAFRRWLSTRHATVDDLRRAWGDAATGLQTMTDAEPPRPPALGRIGSAQVRDWVEFTGWSSVDHLAFLRDLHVELGAGHLLSTVNAINHPVHDVPVREAVIRRATGALVGVDQYYEPPVDARDVARLALGAATARAAGEAIVWAPELMAGIWRSPGEVVPYPDPTPLEQTVWWGAAEALGYQGFTAYMLADRENWEHAPISTRGKLTAFARPVAELLARHRAAPGLPYARLRADVVVPWHYPDAIDAYTVTGTAQRPDVEWADPAARAAYDGWLATLSALVAAGFVYDLWDTSTVPPPPGTVVVMTSGLPADVIARLQASRCLVVSGEDAASALSGAGMAPSVLLRQWNGERPDRALAVLHARGSVAWLHLVSWGAPVRVDVSLAGGRLDALIDVLSGEHYPGADGTVPYLLTPGHRVLAVDQARGAPSR